MARFTSLKKQKGFTLLELLVVIAIIGVLTAVIGVGLNKARVRSRNAKRYADVLEIKKAFELYQTDHGTLPNTTPKWDTFTYGPPFTYCISTQCSGQYATTDDGTAGSIQQLRNQFILDELKPYFPARPSDPEGGARPYSGYIYYPAWPGAPYSYYGLYVPGYGRGMLTSWWGGIWVPWGAYILYSVEGGAEQCGPGTGWNGDGTNFSECALKVDTLVSPKERDLWMPPASGTTETPSM